MTELKTLKDFENNTDYLKWGCDSYQVCLEELKAEAVKWVKERKFLPVPENVPYHVHNVYMHGEREFIKHFFNLTEEDLKESTK